MTTTHSHRSRRRLDLASAALLLVGVLFGALSYWLIAERGVNALVILPAVIAAVTGAIHLVKREAPRD